MWTVIESGRSNNRVLFITKPFIFFSILLVFINFCVTGCDEVRHLREQRDAWQSKCNSVKAELQASRDLVRSLTEDRDLFQSQKGDLQDMLRASDRSLALAEHSSAELRVQLQQQQQEEEEETTTAGDLYVDRLEQRRRRLRSDATSPSSSRRQNRCDISDLEAVAHSWESRALKAETQNAEAVAKVHELESTKSELEAKLETSASQLEQLRVEAIENANRPRSEGREELRQHLEKSEAALMEMQQSLAELSTKKATELQAELSEKLTLAEERIERIQDRKAVELEDERKAFNERILAFETRATASAQEVDQLRQDLRSAESSQTSALRDQAHSYQEQIDTLRSELSQAQDSRAAVSQEAEGLRQELSSAEQSHRSALESQVRSSAEEMKKLRSEFESAQTTHKLELNELQQSLIDSYKKTDELEELTEDLAQGKNELEYELDQLREQQHDAGDDLTIKLSALEETFQQESAAAKERSAHTQEELRAQFRREMEEAERERDALKDDYERDLTTLGGTKAILDKQLACLQDENQSLSREVSNLKHTLSTQEVETKKTVSALESQVFELEQAREAEQKRAEMFEENCRNDRASCERKFLKLTTAQDVLQKSIQESSGEHRVEADSLKTLLAEKSNLLEERDCQLEKLHREKQVAEVKIQELKAEVQKLDAECEASLAQREVDTRELREIRANALAVAATPTNEELEEKLARSQKDVVDLERKLADAMIANKELDIDHTKIVSERSDIQKKFEDLSTEKVELQAKICAIQDSKEDVMSALHDRIAKSEADLYEERKSAKQFQAELSSANARLSELQEKNSHAELEKQKLAMQCDDLEKRIQARALDDATGQDLRAELSAEKARLTSVQIELGVSEKRVTDLQTQLAASTQDAQNISEELRAVERGYMDKLHQADTSKVALESKLSICNNSLEQANLAINNLEELASASVPSRELIEMERKWALAQSELEHTQNALLNANAAIGNFEEKSSSSVPKALLQEMEMKWDAAQSELQKVNHSLECANSTITNFELQSSSLVPKAEFQELQMKLTASRSELEIVNHDLDQAKSAIGILEEKARDCKPGREFEAVQGLLSSAQAEVDELKSKVNAFQEQKSSLEGRVCEGESTIKRLEDELGLSNDERSTLQKRVEENDGVVSSLREQIRFGNAERSRLEERTAEQEKECDAMREKVRAGDVDRSEFEARVREHDEIIDSLQEQVRLCDEQRSRWEEDLASQQRVIDQLTSDSRQAEADLRAQIEEYSTQCSRATERCEEVTDKYRAGQAQLQDAQSKLNDLRANLASTSSKLTEEQQHQEEVSSLAIAKYAKMEEELDHYRVALNDKEAELESCYESEQEHQKRASHLEKQIFEVKQLFDKPSDREKIQKLLARLGTTTIVQSRQTSSVEAAGSGGSSGSGGVNDEHVAAGMGLDASSSSSSSSSAALPVAPTKREVGADESAGGVCWQTRALEYEEDVGELSRELERLRGVHAQAESSHERRVGEMQDQIKSLEKEVDNARVLSDECEEKYKSFLEQKSSIIASLSDNARKLTEENDCQREELKSLRLENMDLASRLSDVLAASSSGGAPPPPQIQNGSTTTTTQQQQQQQQQQQLDEDSQLMVVTPCKEVESDTMRRRELRVLESRADLAERSCASKDQKLEMSSKKIKQLESLLDRTSSEKQELQQAVERIADLPSAEFVERRMCEYDKMVVALQEAQDREADLRQALEATTTTTSSSSSNEHGHQQQQHLIGKYEASQRRVRELEEQVRSGFDRLQNEALKVQADLSAKVKQAEERAERAEEVAAAAATATASSRPFPMIVSSSSSSSRSNITASADFAQGIAVEMQFYQQQFEFLKQESESLHAQFRGLGSALSSVEATVVPEDLHTMAQMAVDNFEACRDRLTSRAEYVLSQPMLPPFVPSSASASASSSLQPPTDLMGGNGGGRDDPITPVNNNNSAVRRKRLQTSNTPGGVTYFNIGSPGVASGVDDEYEDDAELDEDSAVVIFHFLVSVFAPPYFFFCLLSMMLIGMLFFHF